MECVCVYSHSRWLSVYYLSDRMISEEYFEALSTHKSRVKTGSFDIMIETIYAC
jgi:hypothetical protein